MRYQMFALPGGDLESKLNTNLVSEVRHLHVGYAAYRRSRVCESPSVYTTVQEVDYFVKAVDTELKTL